MFPPAFAAFTALVAFAAFVAFAALVALEGGGGVVVNVVEGEVTLFLVFR